MPPRVTERRVPVRIVSGSNTYNFLCLPNTQRVQLNDWPAPRPVSGLQDPMARHLRSPLLVKDIRSSYAHQTELRFGEHGGTIDHLADSELETRFGTIYLPPAENNPVFSIDAVDIVAGATDDSTQPSAVTTANKNPKAAVYYEGSTKKGVYTWLVGEIGVNDYTIFSIRWDGTNWNNEASFLASVFETTAGYDQTVHKGALCFFYSKRDPVNSAGVVARSTNGDTFASMTNSPTANARSGSRLISFQNTLYAVSNVSTGTGTFESITIEKTTDNGGSVWTSVLTGHSGVLRDYAIFQRDKVEEIFLLTNDALYWFDRTNSVLNKHLSLPYEGRALVTATVNGKAALLIYMDGMKRYAYFDGGVVWDTSPGGSQGMPAGKDFGLDAAGQVCLASSAWGTYQLWSGKDNGGTVLRPLCLFFDGSVQLDSNEKVVSTGDHFIWRKADTSISSAARLVILDPQSQDLLIAVQDAISVSTTYVRLKDIEVPPSLQATADRKTSGYMTLSRLDFGDPSLTTTIWDAFLHTAGLGTNETIAVKYGVDGAAATTVTVATLSANNGTAKFPDNTTNAAGTNFTDIAVRLDFATDAVTDLPRLFSMKLSYVRIPPVRNVYIFDIDTLAKAPGIPSTTTQIANLKTIEALKTKALLSYANESSLSVLPIPPLTASEMIGDTATPQSNPRGGIWRLSLLEA